MKFSIRLKVSVFTFCAILLVGGSISLYSIYYWRQQVRTAFAKEAQEIASVISWAVANDISFLDIQSLRYRLKSLQENPSISYVYITDPQGKLLVDGGNGKPRGEQGSADPLGQQTLLSGGWISWVEDGIFKVGGPIFAADRNRVGHLHVGFSLDATNQIIRDTTRTSVYITLVCLGIGVLLAFVVATHFSRPIWSMVWASREIGKGKLGTRLQIRKNDELGALAQSINQMAGQIQRQLHRLAALHDVNVAVTSTLDLRAVLDLLLDKLCLFLPQATSSVRLLNKETGELEPAAWRKLNEEEWRKHLQKTRGGLSQKVLETKAPLIIGNLKKDARVQDREFFDNFGLTSYIGVPMIAKGNIVGVIAFCMSEEHEFGKEEVDLVITLAGQAAIAIHNAQLYEQVREGQEQLRALTHRLAEVQEIERRTISRELHDEIGQALTALKLNLDTSLRVPPHIAKTNLSEAQALANELIGRVRDLSLRLRPAMLDDLGLLPTLIWHCKRYTARTKVRVHLAHNGLEKRFPPDVATAAYRIVQEALTNVVRHSGASEASVRLWGNEETLSILVADQGAGFHSNPLRSPGSTSGLSGMRERAFSLGGQLTVESFPGRGTRVTATLPLGNGNQYNQADFKGVNGGNGGGEP